MGRSRKKTTIKKKVDREFSRYIRLRATDESGHGNCFTCGKRMHWKSVDAGHFMGRAAMSTRWCERNVQFQCRVCNGFKSGEQYAFAQRLDEVYGEGTADELVQNSKQMHKYSEQDMEALYLHYKILALELESER